MNQKAEILHDEYQKEYDELYEKYRVGYAITQSDIDNTHNAVFKQNVKPGDKVTSNPPIPIDPHEAFELFKNFYGQLQFVVQKMLFIQDYGDWGITEVENEISKIEKFKKDAIEYNSPDIYKINTPLTINNNKDEIEYLRLKNNYYEKQLMGWEECNPNSITAKVYGRCFIFYAFLKEKLKELRQIIFLNKNKEKSAIINLDEVLTCLATNPFVIPFVKDWELQDILMKKNPYWEGGYASLELHRILYKLDKEGYIYTEIRDDIANYRISFDGNLFNANGGYKTRFSSDDAERLKNENETLRVQRVDALALDNQKRLNNLTLFLGIATFFAAAPLIMEYYEKHFLQYSYLLYFLSGVIIGIMIWWIKSMLLTKMRGVSVD